MRTIGLTCRDELSNDAAKSLSVKLFLHSRKRAAATATLRGVLARYFPQWRDIPFSHTYGGCVAVTREMVPHVGGTDDGVFHAHGYCGNGISVTHTAAKSLRDLILGRDTAYTNLLFVHGKEKGFPPEPFSYLGGKAVTGALALQDRYPHLIRAQIF